jgi:hypothetical protein
MSSEFDFSCKTYKCCALDNVTDLKLTGDARQGAILIKSLGIKELSVIRNFFKNQVISAYDDQIAIYEKPLNESEIANIIKIFEEFDETL